MKKLSKKWKKWHLNRAANEKTRHSRRSSFFPQVLPSTIECPTDLSLDDNFDRVIELLRKIRFHSERDRNEQVFVDLKKIQTVRPSAALVLAAELDRWNSRPGKGKLRAVDLDLWNKNVRRLLNDLGFFDLLKVKSYIEDFSPTNSRYVRFRKGTNVDGKTIEDLRTMDLDPVIIVPKKKLLFSAVTEAMTNVVHHAYKQDQPKREKNWWLSAAYDITERMIVILLYDQGAGIPKTLPKKFPERLKHLIHPTDAEIIQAAHTLSRSATGNTHRGYGLERDVRKYIWDFAHEIDARYRVISQRGMYTVTVNGEKRREHLEVKESALNGTLIEWRFTVP